MADVTLSADMDAFLITANDAAARTELGAANVAVYAATQINDSNGNELVKFTATASAVNELTIANGATGTTPNGNPTISATGGDTNIGITIAPKGTDPFIVKYDTGAAAYGVLQSWYGQGGTQKAYMREDGTLYLGDYGINTNLIGDAGGGQCAGTGTYAGANCLTLVGLQVSGATGFTHQAISGSGAITAINTSNTSTTIATTGAATTTLAAGTDAQIKILTMITDGGDCVATVTNLQGGTTLTFNDVGDAVMMIYAGNKWNIISNNGVTLA